MVDRFSRLLALIALVASCASTQGAGLFQPEPDPFFPAACVAHWEPASIPLIMVATDQVLVDHLTQAATFWNGLVGLELVSVLQVDTLPVIADGRIVPVSFTPIMNAPTRVGLTKFALGSRCELLRAEVTILTTTRPEIFPQVVAHEVGHVLGLAHSYEAGDLMWPETSPGPMIVAPETIDALQDAYRY